jgi:hypothetical protein
LRNAVILLVAAGLLVGASTASYAGTCVAITLPQVLDRLHHKGFPTGIVRKVHVDHIGQYGDFIDGFDETDRYQTLHFAGSIAGSNLILEVIAYPDDATRQAELKRLLRDDESANYPMWDSFYYAPANSLSIYLASRFESLPVYE